MTHLTTAMNATPINRKTTRLAIFWGGLAGLGTLAGFPYMIALNPPSPPPGVPLPIMAIVAAVQAAVLLGGLSWIGLRLGRSRGLDSPLARALVYPADFRHRQAATGRPLISAVGVRWAVVSGIVAGGMVWGLAKLAEPLMPPVPASLSIAVWKRLLASFYGGITEEVLLRLFLMTLLVWGLEKLGLSSNKSRSQMAVWVAIALSSVLFALAHLPAVAAIWPLTPLVISRTLVLNILPSLMFGYLYWQWGLEYAMLSHFCADIVLHGIGGG